VRHLAILWRESSRRSLRAALGHQCRAACAMTLPALLVERHTAGAH
jgi:hypothetical protein